MKNSLPSSSITEENAQDIRLQCTGFRGFQIIPIIKIKEKGSELTSTQTSHYIGIFCDNIAHGT